MGWRVACVPKLDVLPAPADKDIAVRAQAIVGRESIRARDLQDLPDGFSRVAVPEPQCAVATAGENRPAVGAERHRGDPTLMLQEADELACGGVPEPRRPCPRIPVRTVLPSGLKASLPHFALVPHRQADGLASGRVPQPRRAVTTAGEDGLAVGAERRAPETAWMLQRRADGLASGRVPEPRSAVVTRGEDDPAVGTERGRIDMPVMRQGRTNGLASGQRPRTAAILSALTSDPTSTSLSVGLDCNGQDMDLRLQSQGRPSRSPVVASQTCAVPPSEQVNTVLPSG